MSRVQISPGPSVIIMEDCIFCKLAKSKDEIVAEDKECFVLLDKYPVEYGHMLVISKSHSKDMIEAEEKSIAGMFCMARRMAKLSIERLGAAGANVGTNIGKDAGQVIMHFHIHVVPRYGKNDTEKKGYRNIVNSDGGSGGPKALDQVAAKEIISRLKG